MTRFFSVFLLLASVLVSACANRPALPTVTVAQFQPTPALVATTDPAGAANFDAAHAYAYNRKLAVDIGKRVAGTPGSQAAADFIASEFEKSGLQVTREAFTFQGWEDRGTTVQMLTPALLTIEAQAIQYTVGGKVQGELVAVPGVGSRDDFAQVNVRGKIALVKRGTLQFSEKSRNAAQAGATAVLVYNEAPDSFSGTMRDKVSIPTIGVSGAAGTQLLSQLSKGSVTVSIASDAGVKERTGQNVIGTLPGKSDETIVLGGHYDAVAAGAGAGDNGAGMATILELARVMAGRPQPEHTLVFIAFDAEELGLIGSRAYVNQLSADQLGKLRAMLNFDMLGAGSGPLLLMGDGNAALTARAAAQQLNIKAQNGKLPDNAGSDHQSFARKGVDTVFFMRNYDKLHTPADNIDQIKQEYLDEAGRVAQRLLERLDATPLKDDSSKLMPTE